MSGGACAAQSAERGVDCTLSILTPSLDEQYQDWLAGPAGAEPFGKRADARVMAHAEALSASEPRAAVLDIGAGNGRNALPLARLGLEVDALEPVGELARALREAAAREAVPMSVLEHDLSIASTSPATRTTRASRRFGCAELGPQRMTLA